MKKILALALATALLLALVPAAPLAMAAENVQEPRFTVQTDTAGYYTLRFDYRSAEETRQTMSLFVNSRYAKTVPFEALSGQADAAGAAEAPVYLPQGENDIQLRRMDGDGTVAVDSFSVEPRAGETKLVVVPHEDDEVFAFGGSIQTLLLAGDDVRVALITNGDSAGVDTGVLRIQESVNALAWLGLPRENIFVLGYPDASICMILDADDPTEVHEFYHGDSETYGNPDIPLFDYHTMQTGLPADLSRENLVGDLECLIQAIMPSEIYTTSYYDEHYDHSGTYRLVKTAVLELKEQIGYAPLLHSGVVHSYYVPWPERLTYDANGEPLCVPFTTPFPGENPPLDWEKATKIQLTPEMQKRKLDAINEYVSQLSLSTDCGFSHSFYKSDEFYWTEDLALEE